LLGDGREGLHQTTGLAVGSGPVALATADFNNDGQPDLAVANGKAGTVSIAFGRGKGEFLVTQTIPIGKDPVAIIAADVNADGKPDLVVLNSHSRFRPAY